jgi:uncharacterized protein (TIGR02452 family)
MIKRDGVSLMNKRTKNVSVAKETIEVLSNKQYTSRNGNVVEITEALNNAIEKTILIKNEVLESPTITTTSTIEVTDETTSQAGHRLSDSGEDVVVLNFASGRNPGGGFLAGALAQEEDLCRDSGLYFCLKKKPQFYNENILCEDSYYTDNMIYSPKVPFFRDANKEFLDKPYYLSVITAPAPNVSAMEKVDAEKLLMTLRRRVNKILTIAAHYNHKTIVLGAWGCGAFGNAADQVAEVFKTELQTFSCFEKVCFAVYDPRPNQEVLKVFQQKFV